MAAITNSAVRVPIVPAASAAAAVKDAAAALALAEPRVQQILTDYLTPQGKATDKVAVTTTKTNAMTDKALAQAPASHWPWPHWVQGAIDNGWSPFHSLSSRASPQLSLPLPSLALDVVEHGDRYEVTADVAGGVTASDIAVDVDRRSRRITLAVERRRAAQCSCDHGAGTDCRKSAAPAPTPAPTPTAASTSAPASSAPADAAVSGGVSVPAPVLTAAECKEVKAAAAAAPAAPATANVDTKHSRSVASVQPPGSAPAPASAPEPAATSTCITTNSASARIRGCCGHCSAALAAAAGNSGRSSSGVLRRSERYFGKTQRSFAVARDADLTDVTATLSPTGVLTIAIPRRPPSPLTPPLADASIAPSSETAARAKAAKPKAKPVKEPKSDVASTAGGSSDDDMDDDASSAAHALIAPYDPLEHALVHAHHHHPFAYAFADPFAAERQCRSQLYAVAEAAARAHAQAQAEAEARERAATRARARAAAVHAQAQAHALRARHFPLHLLTRPAFAGFDDPFSNWFAF